MAVYKISSFVARGCLGIKISAFGSFRNISTYRILLVNTGSLVSDFRPFAIITGRRYQILCQIRDTIGPRRFNITNPGLSKVDGKQSPSNILKLPKIT